jgi:hypothetical protein
MPPTREIVKNKREKLRVGPSKYGGYDLIDIRIYVPVPDKEDLVPTKKGVSINVDTVPDVIAALEWSLAQDSSFESERPLPSGEGAEELARAAWEVVGQHGAAVHWDVVERMLKERVRSISKWDLHYVLVKRRDLFQSHGGGTFKAVGYKAPNRKV